MAWSTGKWTQSGYECSNQVGRCGARLESRFTGVGQSSPVIWGDKVFLTTALDKGQERVVLCISRTSGKILWQQSAWKGEPEPVHAMNGWASATCVTDGELVIAFFGRGGIHAYSVDGKQLWSKDLGTFESPWGWLLALSSSTTSSFKTATRTPMPSSLASINHPAKKFGALSDPTTEVEHPIVRKVGDHQELVLNGHEGVRGYDPVSGKELWFCKGFNGRGEPT